MSQNSNANSIDDQEEFETIMYNGKEYHLDDSDNIIYEMDSDGTFIPIGKLISKNPVKIDFKAIRELDLGSSDNSEGSMSNSNFEAESNSEEEVKVKKTPVQQSIITNKKKAAPKEDDEEENEQVKAVKFASEAEVQIISPNATISSFNATHSTKESENTNDSTIDMIQVEYLGKTYVIDMTTNDVYEKIDEQYEIVGKLISDDPLNIKFMHKPDWKDEYTDLEQHTYRNVKYMINPITKHVFGENDTNEYEYLGELLSLEPLEIKFESDISLDEDEDEDKIELEIIESHGVRYVKDNKNNIYDSKKFELIGTWNPKDKEIDFIPTRGLANINNSCYINSVLFALFYRNNKFINDQILRKDIDAMARRLRINKVEVIDAVKMNQAELYKIYKWLHNIEQSQNTTGLCQQFRQLYKQVELGNKPVSFHDDKIETKMGDSGEFLFTLFNGFNIKTLVKEINSYGTSDDVVHDIIKIREEVPPIVMISPETLPENYFNNAEHSVMYGSVVTKMSDIDEEEREQLESKIMIHKIKILLTFFQKKTRVPKLEKERMRQRIDEIGDSKILENGHKDILQIYTELKTKLIQKEIKEIEVLYNEDVNLITLIGTLAELQRKYMFHFTEKIDNKIYKPIDESNNYIVLGIDRTKHIGKTLVKNTHPFDIKENIIAPNGKKVELEFVIKYLDSPKHYVCYFKNIDDDMWYLYNDLSRKFRIVSASIDDKDPGTFQKMKTETTNSCTLLFYN
jgi:hypothetical protein